MSPTPGDVAALRRARLSQAFHDLFDIKDEVFADERLRMKIYSALQALEGVFVELGLEPPRRFDGDGRPENFPAFQACEVCGAVAALAGEFCAACGTKQIGPTPTQVITHYARVNEDFGVDFVAAEKLLANGTHEELVGDGWKAMVEASS